MANTSAVLVLAIGCLVVFTNVCIGRQTGSYRHDHTRLVTALLQDHIDPEVIPLVNVSQPLNVTVVCWLVDILEVDIDRNQVEFLVYFSREYVDDALRWDPDIWGMGKVLINRDFLWNTDIVFENDIGSQSSQPPRPAMAEVKSDGTVSLVDRLRVRTLCQVYALSDRHAAICPLKIASEFHDRSLLWVNAPDENTGNGLLFSDASKYQLLNITSRKDTGHYATGSYETIVVTTTFGRITPRSG